MKISWKYISISVSKAFFATSILFISSKAYGEAEKAYDILIDITNILANPELTFEEIIQGWSLLFVVILLIFAFILYAVFTDLTRQLVDETSKSNISLDSNKATKIAYFIEKYAYALSAIVIIISLIIIWKILAMP